MTRHEKGRPCPSSRESRAAYSRSSFRGTSRDVIWNRTAVVSGVGNVDVSVRVHGNARGRFQGRLNGKLSVALIARPARTGDGANDAAESSGAAYVFVRSGTTWFQHQQLRASDRAADDQFGISVAISGDTIIVGANTDNVGANIDQGSAYIYFLGFNTSPVIVASGPITRQMGSPAISSTIANVSDVLEQVALGKIKVDFIEALACSGGCIGGLLQRLGRFARPSSPSDETRDSGARSARAHACRVEAYLDAKSSTRVSTRPA